MNNSPLVSIILPTYNVEKYLLQCLESIKIQTYQNFEGIIIIDGAIDNSYEIAKEFCACDTRFSVYWQENAGSGPARNNGLAHAQGELVMFIDPDDWVDSDYVESMVKEQQKGNYDFVTTGGKTHHYNKNDELISSRMSPIKSIAFTKQEECRKHYLDLFQQSLLGGPHKKVYKLAIIKEYNILFPNLRRSQDIVFNYRYFNRIENLLVSDYIGYNYRVLYKERLKRSTPDYYKTIILIYNDLKELHQKWGIEFCKESAGTAMINMVYATLEAVVSSGNSLCPIIQEPSILAIIKYGKTQKRHIKLVMFLLRKGCVKIASLILMIISKIKTK